MVCIMKFDPKACKVFTYWEGPKHPFTDLCISSIQTVFGDRHIHLSDNTLKDWIQVPCGILETKHLIFRSDYVRTKLLEAYGGWWFDCDVLLWKDPTELVTFDTPSIWNLIYFWEHRWQPLINCGIVFSPPESPWIRRISHDFDKVDALSFDIVTLENEDIGQQIFEQHSYGHDDVAIGHHHIFNSTTNVNADFWPFVDGRIRLETAQYGLHVGASLSRWARENGNYQATQLLSAQSIDDVCRLFPQSVYAQYYHKYIKT